MIFHNFTQGPTPADYENTINSGNSALHVMKKKLAKYINDFGIEDVKSGMNPTLKNREKGTLT